MFEYLWNKIKSVFTDFYFLGVLLICLILFIYKFQFLNLPYVFDELWVYGSCIREMGIKGPSLLPDALDVGYYRAHPLMFFFIGGVWTTIFGTSVFSTHIFASLMSMLFLVIIYVVSKKIFNKNIGFYAVLILSIQSIFLSQFSLVLPEILITLLALTTVYFYIIKSHFAYFISASLLVLTKESGVVIIGSLVIWNVIDYLINIKKGEFSFLTFIKTNLFLSLPIIFLLIHFVLLKMYFGWYLFPEHINEFEFNWEDFSWRIRKTLNYIFVDEGRQPILIGFISMAILLNQRLSLKIKLFILIIFFSLTKIFFRYWKTIDLIEIYIIPVLFIFVIRYIFWGENQMTRNQQKFIGFSLVFSIIYSLFASSYFDNLRYLFYIFPFFIIVSCFYVSKLIMYKNISLIIFSGICIGFSTSFTIKDKNNGDVNLTYSDVAKLYDKTISYLEDKEYYNQQLKVPFLFKHALTRPLTSYLKSEKVFTNLSDNNNLDDCSQCLLLFTNTDSEFILYKEVKTNPNYELVKTLKEGDVWSEIYKKK